MKKIYRWIRGYLEVSFQSYAIERFMNICIKKQILIWNIKPQENGYTFRCFASDYFRMKPIIKKIQICPHIQKKYGLPFYCFKIRKRKAFFVGMLFFFLILYFCSLILWRIQIDGEYTHTKESLLKFLAKNEIHTGMKMDKINCYQLEELIRTAYPDIGWVSAEKKGTVLNLSIKEINALEEQMEEPPCHIVAAKEGTITLMITRSGTPCTSIGSKVHSGDILVSGIVDVIGDNELLLRKKVVTSSADISIRTTYEYIDRIPLWQEEKVYTGKTSYALELLFAGKNLHIELPFQKFELCDSVKKAGQIKIGQNFQLPIQFDVTKYREFENGYRILSQKEAMQKAKEHFELYLQKLIEKGVLILGNNVKILCSDSECVISGTVFVEENATQKIEIEENEWRIEPEHEYSGNTD